jgi:16S rRNA (cytidine1402-2'-O)-methyltransferase
MPELILIPTPITEDGLHDISDSVMEQISGLRFFVVENLRTARRILRKMNFKADFDAEVQFFELDKHVLASDLSPVKGWMHSNQDIGLMSEAGMPCIADPGHLVVQLAHQAFYNIRPLVGPSSILLALISSGFNGQNFAFNGYLPIDKNDRQAAIKKLEQRMISEKQTQLFMETPYRNLSIIDDILRVCHGTTYLSIAADIGSNNSVIQSKMISEWRKSPLPELHKKPAIFGLGFF